MLTWWFWRSDDLALACIIGLIREQKGNTPESTRRRTGNLLKGQVVDISSRSPSTALSHPILGEGSLTKINREKLAPLFQSPPLEDIVIYLTLHPW